MTKIFLTGDRSINPFLAMQIATGLVTGFVAQALLTGDTLEIVTGDNKGVEACVRAMCEVAEVPVHVIPTGTDPDTGKPAWDTRHEVVSAYGFDAAYLVHTDPLSSSIGASAMKVLGDRLELLTPA